MNKTLKKQFEEMKAKHPDSVLLFGVDDFYEAYNEDAESVADVLGITLTKKGDTKMAGFPRHSLDNYLPKLVHAGKRVAMCDQLTDPKEVKPLVKRGATEMPSPLGEVKKIKIADIWPSPMNPRKTFDEEAICELADSIKQHGLLQPITVRPKDKAYEIVMGERRFRAWQENYRLNPKFPNEIPCIVRVMSDEEALDAMITENLQRKDVDPIEEAFAFGQLVKTGKSIEEIALRFGKSKRFIQERIKLDNLLPELKSWVTKGEMNIGAAMHISKLTAEEQQKFLDGYEPDEDDPITKQDAENFTNHLFMTIAQADWPKDYEGSCGTTCEKCPFNNANVGCLFYEMKPHNANCTNRAKWNNKRFSWFLQIIKQNEDVLIKEGEALEPGKMVIVIDPTPYRLEKCKDEHQRLIDAIMKLGFRTVNKEDIFERFSSYDRSDTRLKEKLENNEVYRCLVVYADYRGPFIKEMFYEFKKNPQGEDSDQAKAMQLVNQYRENINKSAENKSNRLRTVLNEMNPEELSKGNLSENEGLIFFALILRRCSHKFRDLCGVVGYDQKKSLLDFVIENKELCNRIRRDYMREVLGGTDVTWSADLQQCQSLLLQEWAKDKVDEVEGEYAAKLAKKQEKIKEKLLALGYNTDGTKMDF